MTARRQPTAEDAEDIGRAFDTLRRTKVIDDRPLPPTCRCGQPDHRRTERPVADMTAAPGVFAFDSAPIGRPCRVCDHSIYGTGVSHRPLAGHAVRNFYHPECIDFGATND